MEKYIKNTRLVRYSLLAMMLILFLMQGCLKKEYMPPQVGAQIPYAETVTVRFRDALSESAHTVFYQAWQRSHIDEILGTIGDSKTKYTILVPDNAALQAAGWTMSSVNAASIEALDTLMMKHVFRNRITPEELHDKAGNYQAVSMLDLPTLRYTADNKTYYFRVGLSYDGDALWVNGKPSGNTTPIPAVDGYIWPIKHVLEVPVKTAWEVIRSDNRFSLYVSLLHYTDSAYKALFEAANGHPPAAGHIAEQAYDRNSPLYYGMDYHPPVTGNIPYVENPNTWFIPTNEAFQQAGFHTLEDLVAWNESRNPPWAEWVSNPGTGLTPYYRLVGDFATDTLLDYHHNWGMRIASYEFTRERNATLFFSNDLQQELLANYPVTAYTEITYGYYYPQRGTTNFYFMPFVFPGNNQIRVKGASGPAATLIDKDINTLNGVIHAVDRLLLP